MIPSRAVRRSVWAWAPLGVVIAVALVVGARTTPTEGVSDDRLFSLASQLKCQQCVGESVEGSQSPSAVQFREEIRDQMAQGRTDDEILSFFVDRYGQDVLLSPPGTGLGAAVWVVPVVAVAVAVLLLVGALRRRDGPAVAEVSEEDRRRVEAELRRRNPSGS